MEEKISFTDKIREDLILLDIDGNTRDEVLEQIASVLRQKGIVKESFYDALIERENAYPTGLPIGEVNVAIPHTYPEHINEVAITIAIPRNPVIFGNMGARDEELLVHVIVCLTMRKSEDNVKLLPALMDFFAQETNLRGLLACKTPAEVINFIN